MIRHPMRFLSVATLETNAEAYLETLQSLVTRGHEMVVAVQERDVARDSRLAERIVAPRFRVVGCSSARVDARR